MSLKVTKNTACFAYPLMELNRKDIWPLILVQFSKESIFAALIVVAVASWPVPNPLQTVNKHKMTDVNEINVHA